MKTNLGLMKSGNDDALGLTKEANAASGLNERCDAVLGLNERLNDDILEWEDPAMIY